jgi:hypothetical protein
VFEWHKKFKEVQKSLLDDEWEGRPSTSRTELTEVIQKFLAEDQTSSVRMLEEMTGINKETVRKILAEDLKKKKVCTGFVPHLLMPDQKHQHAASPVEFVEMTDDNRNALKRIVTGDESWCFMHNPETASELSPQKPKAQKVRMEKSWVKTMLTAFFDAKDIIHGEFVPEKQTVNGKFYKEVIAD